MKPIQVWFARDNNQPNAEWVTTFNEHNADEWSKMDGIEVVRGWFVPDNAVRAEGIALLGEDGQIEHWVDHEGCGIFSIMRTKKLDLAANDWAPYTPGEDQPHARVIIVDSPEAI